jgi:serine/threonine-protein kinase
MTQSALGAGDAARLASCSFKQHLDASASFDESNDIAVTNSSLSSGYTRLSSAMAGRYRIERELGAGGMATVYLAHDLKHERKVAIKVLKPELAAVLGAERFVVEIKTTASLQHPHILPLFDSGESDGLLYYVMPFIEGETIRAKLDRETQFGVEEAVRIAREVADALDYAHRRGVIHRDIKPENILLHDGRAMVMDFGIALAVSAAAGGRMTETGLSLGTPHYMSPEQATAEKDSTPRSDIYSLGAVLYEMLTGNAPHSGASAQQIIMKIITEPVEPVTKYRKSVPANVGAAVAKALEKLPADRFENAKAFSDALANPAFVGASTPLVPATRPTRRTVSMAAFAATTAVLGASLIGVATWALQRPTAPAPVVARFTLDLPDSARPPRAAQTWVLAISPDGSEIVYRGLGRSRPALFRRTLSNLAVTEIADGSIPVAATYSNDGRSLLTVTNTPQALWRTSLPSGARTRLFSDATNPTERDGVIVFYRDGGLMRANVAGGEPTRHTGPDSSRFDNHPEVLPGGKWAVFGRLERRRADAPAGEARVADIYAVSLADGSTKSLGIKGIAPHYVSTGHIVVGSVDGVLLAAPFDVSSVTVRGPLIPVQEGVLMTGRNLNSPTFAISDNGTLVYAQGVSSLVPLIVDRTGAEHPLDVPRGQYTHPRFSPSADRLVIEQREGTATDLYVLNRATGLMTRLTHDGKSHSPEWTPDGSRIAWLRTDSNQTTLVWQRADGSGPMERIPIPDVALHRFVFSPSGKFIVAAVGPAGKHDLMLIPLDASMKPRKLVDTPFDEVAPSVSPDDKWVAYATNESGQYEVWIASIEHPETRIQITTAQANAPVWRDAKTVIVSGNFNFIATSLSFSPRIEVMKRDSVAVTYHGGSNDRVSDFNPKTGEFVVLTSESQQQNRIVVVTNWFEELKSRFAQPAKP